MNNFHSTTLKLASLTLLVACMPVFAESAPVYDVDSMPQQQQYETVTEANNTVVPQEELPGDQEGFVPMHARNQQAAADPRASVDQRIRRIEQQIDNMQDSDTSARIESLQNQVQALQGQLEQVTHQLEIVQNQQKSINSDMDARLAQAAKTPAVAVETMNSKQTPANAKGKSIKPVEVTEATAADDQPNVAEEQQIYQTAYSLIKEKKYAEAVTALQGMLSKYPSGQFAANAHYWLGELYGVMGKNEQAINEFNTVLKTYPDSPRVSDAQLKLGIIFTAQLKWSDAKTAFKKVINHYPGTTSSRLAAEQLKQIKQAGH